MRSSAPSSTSIRRRTTTGLETSTRRRCCRLPVRSHSRRRTDAFRIKRDLSNQEGSFCHGKEGVSSWLNCLRGVRFRAWGWLVRAQDVVHYNACDQAFCHCFRDALLGGDLPSRERMLAWLQGAHAPVRRSPDELHAWRRWGSGNSCRSWRIGCPRRRHPGRGGGMDRHRRD